MNVINLKSTGDTPAIILDAENNNMEITGKCFPEDVNAFFKPVMEWLSDYSKKPNNSTHFKFKLDYYNTASSKNILSVLMTLKVLYMAGNDVTVEWNYNEDDEEIQESGIEFERLVKIPFIYKKYSNQV
jgi:hypothetical protein